MLQISSRRGLKVSSGFPDSPVQEVQTNKVQGNTSMRIVMSGILLALTVMLLTRPVAAGQENSAMVAEVNGDKLTVADLEQREATELLQSRYKYYQAERKALDDLIDQHLLEMQARPQNLPAEHPLHRPHNTKPQPDPPPDHLP